jgi:putative ABC transport system permease protein
VALWRQGATGLRALLRRREHDRDIADEVRQYLDEAVAAHRERGLPPEEALRAAHIELGGVTRVREQVRSVGWENGIDTLIGDLRYAARRLRAAPGFTAITVSTLALGIGAATAIFSAVNPILFESLPYPHADRVTAIWEIGRDGSRVDATFGMYRALSERSRSFEALAVFRSWQPTFTSADQPERFDGQRVSASYFRVLGVSPAMGRGFHPAEDRAGGPNVAVISDALWRRRFAADPGIVGRDVTLNGTPFVIVGVMPRGFENVTAPAAEIWAPLQYDMSENRAWGHHLRMIGRLRDAVTTDGVARELDALGRRVLEVQRPETYGEEVRFAVSSLQAEITRGVRPALVAILGAVGLLLVIACVNVTNLILARGVRRRGELALRAALGAGRMRLVRQVLTENLLLALLGGLVAMPLAALGVRAFIAMTPTDLPRAASIAVDGAAFLFAMAITAIAGLALGATPAVQAGRSDPHAALQGESRRTVGGHRRARGALVVAEVSLALVLLVSSGLLLRSLTRLFAVDAGFDPTGLLSMQVQTSGPRFGDDSTTTRFFSEALEAVRRVPGVTEAALTSQLPLSNDLDQYGVHFDPIPTNDPGEVRGTFRYAVSPGYLETMRIPLRRGRLLRESDRASAPPVVLVSESLARRRLAGLDPIGQRLRIGPPDSPLYTVVGVVGDVKQQSLAVNEPDAVYLTTDQWRFGDNTMSLVVRTRGEPMALVTAIRRAIWSVDKDQPIVRVATMEELLATSAAQRRFALIVFEAFALVALVLAAAGMYGVLAGTVAERAREMGIRAALGATSANLLAMVVRQGVSLTALGVALGLVGAVAATRAIGAMLFGVSRLDPLTYVGVVALLGIVSALASALPAWRAARVDPASALRAE